MLPLAHHGLFAAGANKAVAFGLVLPLLPIVLAVPLVLGGVELLPDLLLVGELTLLLLLLWPYLLQRNMPFTERFNPRESGSQISVMMLRGMLIGFGVIVQVVLGMFPILLIAVVAALVPVIFLLNANLRRMRILEPGR